MSEAIQKAENGYLIKKDQLASRFNLVIDEDNEGNKLDTGHFEAQISIKRVREPILVKVEFKMVLDKYIQLSDYSVTYTSNSLGEKLQQNLKRALRDELYNDEKMFAPREINKHILYGKQYTALNNVGYYSRRDAIAIEKIDASSLDLIAEHKHERTNWRGEGIGEYDNYHYFVDKKSKHLYFRHVENEHENRLKLGNDSYVFQYLSDGHVVDENKYIYFKHDTKDKKNLRLFTMYTSYREKYFETLQRNTSYDEFKTYKEFLQLVKDSHSELYDDMPKDPTVPFTFSGITVYSEAVLGEDIPDYSVGTWVKNEKNELGKIVSKQGDVLLNVLWEGEYAPNRDTTPYHKVTFSKNPYKKRKDKQLVAFQSIIDYDPFYGFGYITEESEKYYKIKPLTKMNDKKDLFEALWRREIPSHRYNSTLDKAKDMLKKIHGDDVEFLFSKKDDIFPMDDEEKEFVLEYFNDSKEYEEMEAFCNIFKWARSYGLSSEYFALRLLYFLPASNMVRITNKLYDIYEEHPSNVYFYKEINHWFEVLKRKRRFKLSS